MSSSSSSSASMKPGSAIQNLAFKKNSIIEFSPTGNENKRSVAVVREIFGDEIILDFHDAKGKVISVTGDPDRHIGTIHQVIDLEDSDDDEITIVDAPAAAAAVDTGTPTTFGPLTLEQITILNSIQVLPINATLETPALRREAHMRLTQALFGLASSRYPDLIPKLDLHDKNRMAPFDKLARKVEALRYEKFPDAHRYTVAMENTVKIVKYYGIGRLPPLISQNTKNIRARAPTVVDLVHWYTLHSCYSVPMGRRTPLNFFSEVTRVKQLSLATKTETAEVKREAAIVLSRIKKDITDTVMIYMFTIHEQEKRERFLPKLFEQWKGLMCDMIV